MSFSPLGRRNFNFSWSRQGDETTGSLDLGGRNFQVVLSKEPKGYLGNFFVDGSLVGSYPFSSLRDGKRSLGGFVHSWSDPSTFSSGSRFHSFRVGHPVRREAPPLVAPPSSLGSYGISSDGPVWGSQSSNSTPPTPVYPVVTRSWEYVGGISGGGGPSSILPPSGSFPRPSNTWSIDTSKSLPLRSLPDSFKGDAPGGFIRPIESNSNFGAPGAPAGMFLR